VGHAGTIRFSGNGGGTWGGQTSGTPNDLFGVSCPDTTHCWAVGHGGTIRFSNGGGTWTGQTSGTKKDLRGVSSPDAHSWAVGQDGTILAF
jgi:hypothetical protein